MAICKLDSEKIALLDRTTFSTLNLSLAKKTSGDGTRFRTKSVSPTDVRGGAVEVAPANRDASGFELWAAYRLQSTWTLSNISKQEDSGRRDTLEEHQRP